MSTLSAVPTGWSFSERRALWAFAAGCVAVTAGVVLHLPMYLMAAPMGYRLAGMPMDAGMLAGMALIVAGVGLAGYGILPRRERIAAGRPRLAVSPPEDAPLTGAHLRLLVVLAIALVIDVMKPASLGFVVPGMMQEYGLPRSVVAWLPFSALLGTFVGSIVWGVLADLYGRRASILLSAIMFVGTSICGAMPSFWWNVAMCFLMGAAAGGMLPATYALLAEVMPTRHRGWALVLLGGLGAVGGYLLASGLATVLQPQFGWRIMWFLNLPTGLMLIGLGGLIPESARFLTMIGRTDAAQATLRQFGSVVVADPPAAQDGPTTTPTGAFLGKTLALTMAGVAWGVINFGLLLWLPADMVARGASMAASSGLLAKSALIALPTVFVASLFYSRWSTKGSLVASLAVTALGLIGAWRLGAGGLANPMLPIALLIVGSNALIAIILPYAAESYPLRIRGRATGWVAGCTKMGGLFAQLLALFSAVPPLALLCAILLAPVGLAMMMIGRFGAETRGRDLREVDASAANLAAVEGVR